jgi:hypothetical protein
MVVSHVDAIKCGSDCSRAALFIMTGAEEAPTLAPGRGLLPGAGPSAMATAISEM